MTLRTLNYGNYGIFLNMDNAGFISSTVWTLRDRPLGRERGGLSPGFWPWGLEFSDKTVPWGTPLSF